MIIQKVIKGIGGIDRDEAERILRTGIKCRWWREVDPLPNSEIPMRLTERNLIWHQNRYDEPDPDEGGQPFYLRTAFISTTAGTVERDKYLWTNTLQPAWRQALFFATDSWKRDGYLFYCYVFIIGKKSVGHRQFAEELRELNIYTDFTPFHPEGEITAKIIIPPTQIQKAEFWSLKQLFNDIVHRRIPRPVDVIENQLLYLPAENYHNIRDVLA